MDVVPDATSIEPVNDYRSVMPPVDTSPTSKKKSDVLTSNAHELKEIKGFKCKDDDLTKFLSHSANTLRAVKVVSLLLIGVFALFGMVFSKITFVSITSRMYTLYMHPNKTQDDHETISGNRSAIFFQIVVILIVPEIVCLGHCLIWGFIGKSSKTFPWPSWKSIVSVSNAN